MTGTRTGIVPTSTAGRITEIAGWVMKAAIDVPLRMRELVFVGNERLIGEVIALERTTATVQVYEETDGVAPGDPIFSTGEPLSIELGPGLLGEVFDGIQRPLRRLAEADGDFIARGSRIASLDRQREWAFEPLVDAGMEVVSGVPVGRVAESGSIAHPILVPPGVSGRVVRIAAAGPHRVSDVIAAVDDGTKVNELTMFHRWQARVPRPVAARSRPERPLITGQRVLDTFFPLTRGGAAAMPGGFGTGKTVTQHQLCRWADADVIIFVGCGERGNEIAELVRELPALLDPRTGHPLAERSILIANTSNMPVSAREASIFTGVTIGEYYRDLGYDVLLLADSISRWAEALREISGRLGEMPAEEGYPPYLSSALASFFERAGEVTTFGGARGSLTIIGAISPPAGDLTEPVTRHAQRFVRTFWTLDRQLASARVFPAVNPSSSYSDVPSAVDQWWADNVSPAWAPLRREALTFMAEAALSEETARLVGPDSLPERDRFVLALSRAFREGFLQQSAYDAGDASCPPARQVALLSRFMEVRRSGEALIAAGTPANALPFDLAGMQRLKLAMAGEPVAERSTEQTR